MAQSANEHDSRILRKSIKVMERFNLARSQKGDVNSKGASGSSKVRDAFQKAPMGEQNEENTVKSVCIYLLRVCVVLV